MTNKIIVATGTSQHKMEFAVNFIQEYCTKKGINADVEGVNIYTADIASKNPNVIVLIGPNNIKIDVPVILGICFITKFGMEKSCEDIIKYLN